MKTINYKKNVTLSAEQVIALYQKTTLGKRRPIDRPEDFQAMLDHANLVISAWDGEQLVGLARSLTDFNYVNYLADLAVDEAYQRQGIGKDLIAHTQASLSERCIMVLLAAPSANEYYCTLGFEHHPRAWVKRPKSVT